MRRDWAVGSMVLGSHFGASLEDQGPIGHYAGRRHTDRRRVDPYPQRASASDWERSGHGRVTVAECPSGDPVLPLASARYTDPRASFLSLCQAIAIGISWPQLDLAPDSTRDGNTQSNSVNLQRKRCMVEQIPHLLACQQMMCHRLYMSDSKAIESSQFPIPRVVVITPEMASEILRRNPDNRPLDKSLVTQLVGEIRNGGWQVTHQGIALDGPLTTGNIVDGQHRLRAIMQSGVTTPVLVFENVPPATFSALDTGKRRTGGDVLALSGERDCTLLSATIRHVHLFRTSPSGSWVGSGSRVTNNDLLVIFQAQVEEFRTAVKQGRILGKELGLIPTAGASAYFLTVESAPVAQVGEWIRGLTTQANLDSDDPRLALIKVMSQLRGGGTQRRRTDTRGQIGLYIKAWNAWVSGRPVKSLRLQKGEKMPSPIQMLIAD